MVSLLQVVAFHCILFLALAIAILAAWGLRQLARGTGRTLLRSRSREAALSVLLASWILVQHAAANETLPEHAGSWSSFQNGGRLADVPGPLPKSWNASSSIAWDRQLEGYGQSSPVVLGDRVFVTSTSGANKERYHLAAIRLADGEVLWQQTLDNPSPEANTTYVSRAAPTPAADADGVIAFFEGGLVAAFDHQGQLRCKIDLVQQYGSIESRHGLAASVEQDATRAYVWVERTEAPYLLALDKKTGEVIWQVDGVGATSWSSPRLIPLGHDSAHLVCSAIGRIVGYDPATGARLWELEDVANNSSATPVPCGTGRFLIGASDGRGEQTSGAAAESNGLIEINEIDGTFMARFVWRAKKATCTFGSPIVAGDRAYFVNRAGVVYCLDAGTGEELYARRTRIGSVWATPLDSGESIYLFGRNGETEVITTGEDFTSQAVNRLWEPQPSAESADPQQPALGGPVLYGVAAAPPYLLLRRGDCLYAVKAGNEDSLSQ